MSEDKQMTPYNELMPVSLAEKIEMAKYLSQSGLMPNGLHTPAQVFVALQMGHELGLAPMVAVNNIAVINGKPTLSAQIMDAIVKGQKDYAGMTIDAKEKEFSVTIRRRVGENVEEYTGTFSIEDANKAGLMGKDNWKKYPKRMLKHRALAFAARDAFPDALAGMYTKEEMMDSKPEPKDVTPRKAPAELKQPDKPADNSKPEKDPTPPAGVTKGIPIPQLLNTRIDGMPVFAPKAMKEFTASAEAAKDDPKALADIRAEIEKRIEGARIQYERPEKEESQQQEKRRGTTERVPKQEGALMDEVKKKTEAGKVEDAEVDDLDAPDDGLF